MPVATISPAEVFRLIQSGKPANLIDVRTPAEFNGVHAAGARSIPLDAFDPATIAGERKAGDEPIYVICQAGGRSANACERLEKAGVAPVFSVEGGTTAWERAGLPVQRSGVKVMSLERQVRIAAGVLVLIGVILAWLVHPAFVGLCAFIGAGLVFAGVTDFCGMGILLGKMPWNRGGKKRQNPAPLV